MKSNVRCYDADRVDAMIAELRDLVQMGLHLGYIDECTITPESIQAILDDYSEFRAPEQPSEADEPEERPVLRVGSFLGPKVPGYNTDKINPTAGLLMLQKLGWDPQRQPNTFMLIDICLNQWRRGEEDKAERKAIGQGESDPVILEACIDLTSWRAVLAAAMAGAE